MTKPGLGPQFLPQNPLSTVYNHEQLFKQWVWWAFRGRQMTQRGEAIWMDNRTSAQVPSLIFEVSLDFLVTEKGYQKQYQYGDQLLNLSVPNLLRVTLNEWAPLLIFVPMFLAGLGKSEETAALQDAIETAKEFADEIGAEFPGTARLFSEKQPLNNNEEVRYAGITVIQFLNWLEKLL
jgi:hypothetical protein